MASREPAAWEASMPETRIDLGHGVCAEIDGNEFALTDEAQRGFAITLDMEMAVKFCEFVAANRKE
jgi:hypothetical protein